MLGIVVTQNSCFFCNRHSPAVLPVIVGNMPPPGRFQSLKHRIRDRHPLRGVMQSSLRRIEHASAEEITRYQERRLRALVRVAAGRSPFYREWFAASGVDPASIRTLEDLGKLPLLERTDLVEGSDRFRVYPKALTWAAHSSGTSGEVVTTHRTPGSSAFELSVLERQWGWFGVPTKSRRLVVRGSRPGHGRDNRGSHVIPGARHLVLSSYHVDVAVLPRLLEDIRRFRPHAIEGWPSSITMLASRLHEAGERLPLNAVITSSEVMTNEQMALMRTVFSAPIIDHYGQTERVTMAGNCEAGGYHLFPDYGITELIPVEGQPSRWELVGTPLHNWGFPLFRYRTGDQVGPAPVGPCACGRSFDLLGPIQGRLEDSFTAADGRMLPLPSIVIDDLVGLREVQIAQLAAGRFEIRMAPRPDTDLHRIQAQALRNVEQYFGRGQVVTFRVLDRIPRSPGGKLRSAVVIESPESGPA